MTESRTIVPVDDGLPALKRGFGRGILLVVALMICAAGAIKAFGTGKDRPEGAAERWLAAVADTTREGVQADARERAEKIGPLSLAAGLLPAGDTDGNSAFSDLEVGNAIADGEQQRIPFQLHQYAAEGEEPQVSATIVLQPVPGGGWSVVAVDSRRPGEKVPSEGGEPPTRAPLGAWLGGVLMVALLCAGGSLAIRAATPKAAPAPTS